MGQKRTIDAEFIFKEQVIPYQIVQTDRKSVAITVDKEANTVIRAPLYMSEKQVKRIVLENKERIYLVYKKVGKQKKAKPIVSIKDASSIPFYGNDFPFYLQSTTGREHIEDDGKCIELFVNFENPGAYDRAVRLLEIWYRKKGKEVFYKKANEFAVQMGTTFQNIAIKDQKTRWGSCSNHRNLNFNWRLLMMPREVLDYVVIHELAHTIEMNHSKDFWLQVERLVPDYKKYRKYLKEEASKFRIE